MNKKLFKGMAMLMCVGVIGAALSGCSKKEELFSLVTKDPQELTLEDVTINIDGVNVSLFRNVEETIQSSQNKLVYDSNTAETVGNKNQLVFINVSKEEAVKDMTEIQGRNFTDSEIKKEEARIDNISVYGYGFSKQQIILPNQLSYGDSQAKVIEKCGQPMRAEFNDKTETYYYYDAVKMNHVFACMTFEEGKLTAFSYNSMKAKEIPAQEIKSFNTEEVTGLKPCIDVLKMEVGPNKEILTTKTVIMGVTELKEGMTFGQFIEDGWEVKKVNPSINELVDVQMQRGEDKCVLTVEENHTNESIIKKILVTTPFNVDLIPTFPGDVDALEWNAMWTNYGKPSYLNMNKGLYLSYIVDNVQMSAAYDSELQLDYYSMRFDMGE